LTFSEILKLLANFTTLMCVGVCVGVGVDVNVGVSVGQVVQMMQLGGKVV